MGRIAEIEHAALSLDAEARARLAALLIESLETAQEVDEKQVELLWLAEAEERCRQIDAGEVEMIPAEEVIERLRARLD